MYKKGSWSGGASSGRERICDRGKKALQFGGIGRGSRERWAVLFIGREHASTRVRSARLKGGTKQNPEGVHSLGKGKIILERRSSFEA